MFHGARRRRRTKSKASTDGEKKSGRSNNRSNSGSSDKNTRSTMSEGKPPAMSWVMLHALLYVLSGVTQPILMAYAQHAGLADPRCQLYMLFYYLGPASVAFTLRRRKKRRRGNGDATRTDGAGMETNGKGGDGCNNCQSAGTNGKSYGSTFTSGEGIAHGTDVDDGCDYDEADEERSWPSTSLLAKASAIALFDIFAQSMVYTGNNMAGPTIFAIVYSSVTVWAALYSKLLLSRSLAPPQWMGVVLVVVGLSLTALDSLAVGRNVFVGAMLIVGGSSAHGLTYVLSEWIMTAPPATDAEGMEMEKGETKRPSVRREPRHISVRANCAIQGIVATLALLLWQIFYTFPRRQTLVFDPMAEAGTTPVGAWMILGYIALANLVHSVTFFSTLKNFPGGATSAGVLKGLQAVLVFAASALVLCGRWGGLEMCWSGSKFASLVVVVCGILMYGTFTKGSGGATSNDTPVGFSLRLKGGYGRVDDVGGEEGKIMCV